MKSIAPTTTLEELALERVQLTIDLCDLLWRQHEVDGQFQEELARCTSWPELREELARQCFYRARRKLHPEIQSLESAALV